MAQSCNFIRSWALHENECVRFYTSSLLILNVARPSGPLAALAGSLSSGPTETQALSSQLTPLKPSQLSWEGGGHKKHSINWGLIFYFQPPIFWKADRATLELSLFPITFLLIVLQNWYNHIIVMLFSMNSLLSFFSTPLTTKGIDTAHQHSLMRFQLKTLKSYQPSDFKCVVSILKQTLHFYFSC